MAEGQETDPLHRNILPAVAARQLRSSIRPRVGDRRTDVHARETVPPGRRVPTPSMRWFAVAEIDIQRLFLVAFAE